MGATMVTDGFQTAKAAALAGFADTGPDHLNCAQAVVRFASIMLGADEDSVVLARYFGGGMTRMGEICGALSGAALSLGLRDRTRAFNWADGQSPDTEKLQELFRQFEAEFGATTCRGLIGYLTDTTQGYERFKAEDRYASCRSYVSWVCDHVGGLLATAG
jgi:C_GCAxxG_C_C family probable redox protein